MLVSLSSMTRSPAWTGSTRAARGGYSYVGCNPVVPLRFRMDVEGDRIGHFLFLSSIYSPRYCILSSVPPLLGACRGASSSSWSSVLRRRFLILLAATLPPPSTYCIALYPYPRRYLIVARDIDSIGLAPGPAPLSTLAP